MTKSHSSPHWKEVFRDGMYACVELQERKMHRDLLSYLVHRAHRASKLCWQSQAEMAAVARCSVRNVHDLLVYLETLGAIFSVKVTGLPKKDQDLIRKLTPNKAIANAKAYYLSDDWARDVLAEGNSLPASEQVGITISPDDRARGRQNANDRRRRYAPQSMVSEFSLPSNPAHDEWQFMNGAPEWTGSPTSAPSGGWTGSPTTDMTNDINPAANSAINIRSAYQPIPSSRANQSPVLISSLSDTPAPRDPHGYGGGEAIACDPSPQGLVGYGRIAHETPEYDAARARTNERKAS